MGNGGGGAASIDVEAGVTEKRLDEVVVVSADGKAVMDDSLSGEEDRTYLKNGSIPNRGRTWTVKHQKALLTIVQDEDCCCFEKQSNAERNNASKLLLERLRGSYPKLFGGWLLQRRIVRRRLHDILRLHRDNEQEALRATGRGGGRSDEEFVHLCEEVSERMREADAEKGAQRSQKTEAREEKERAGEVLKMHQLRTGGKRSRTQTPSSGSPQEETPKGTGRRRRSSSSQQLDKLIPELRASLLAMRRGRVVDRAMLEWNMRIKLYYKDPRDNPHPGPMQEYIDRHLAEDSNISTSYVHAQSSGLAEVEVDSPNKDPNRT
eukprot:scaffold346_cov347-Pavlova_lutheri.AAC.59